MFRPSNRTLKTYLEYSSTSSEKREEKYSLHISFTTNEEAATLFNKMNAWNIGLPIQLNDNRITFLPATEPHTAGVLEVSLSHCNNMICYLAIYIPHSDYASILFQAIALDDYKIPWLKNSNLLFYKRDLVYPACSYTRRVIAMNAYQAAMDIQLILMRHGLVSDIISLVLQVFISLIRHTDVPQLIKLQQHDPFHLLSQSVPFLLSTEKIPVEPTHIQYSLYNNHYSLHIFCATESETEDLFKRIKEECDLPVYKNPAMRTMLWIMPKQKQSGVYSITMPYTSMTIPHLDIHFLSVCHKKKFMDALDLTKLPAHLMMDPNEKSSTQLVVDKKSLSEFNIHTLLNAILLSADNYLLENKMKDADIRSIAQLKEACLAWAKQEIQPEEIAHLIHLLFIRYALIDPVIKKYLDEVKEILEIIGIRPNIQPTPLSTTPYRLFSKSITPPSCAFENSSKKGSCLIL